MILSQNITEQVPNFSSPLMDRLRDWLEERDFQISNFSDIADFLKLQETKACIEYCQSKPDECYITAVDQNGTRLHISVSKEQLHELSKSRSLDFREFKFLAYHDLDDLVQASI